ncbi:hydrogenase large subunit [Desulfonispora thiosulfatigenes DSM 11270]|uniref:Hydrogenase large subunit n=1 Tax=Desulfonispora thiosulfatigenes DSM 11270 TaxID=656914 RepID=A0A1W1VC26_DESTI|nr:nickel-dependent hydrogenase large subunit [Desulfonispora thiosulfatigenes]SMB90524.1 hydrogenase large subunit [Desulfonispora thiosulfatigenes DSM 11270]
MAKITINPLTRISGFLEIEVEVEKNKIINAKSSGMLFRGFEKMLKGRSPLDSVYFTQRICGICSTAHSMASSLALENLLNIEASNNDKMIRDFMHGCEFIQNHLRHFYQYSLPDFVYIPSISPLGKEKMTRLPENINNKLANNYFTSLEYSKMAHEMLAALGGKAPHNHGIFVGGVTVNLDIDIYNQIKFMLEKIKTFVEQEMITDVSILAKYYPEYFENGIGYKNLMTFGSYNNYQEPELNFVNPKVLVGGKIYPFDANKITENIHYSWYRGEDKEYIPYDEMVEVNREKENAYSFIKAPRYGGLPMEVGPLARMYLSGEYNRGISTMDRIIARVLEVRKIVNILEGLLQRFKLRPAEQKVYVVNDGQGKCLIDTTRGGLGHWIEVKDNKIEHYEIITPTVWNLSPRDSKGQLGVIEKALIGTEIEDIGNPVEIGRIVRSYDPCVSCATHIVSDAFSPFKIRII